MRLDIHDMLDGYVDEEVELSADTPTPERVKELTLGRLGELPKPKRRLRISTVLIAAVITVLALTVSVLAADTVRVLDRSEAVEVCNRELDRLRELGVITADFEVSKYNSVINLTGDPTAFQIFMRDYVPHYSIRVDGYLDGGKYNFRAELDADTGKLLSVTLTAIADEDDIPSRYLTYQGSGEQVPLYANFDDILDESMTLGQFCDRLCQYWGYSGYTLLNESDSPEALVADYRQKRIDVQFDGDEAGVPQYIEVNDFANGACILFGLRHGLG